MTRSVFLNSLFHCAPPPKPYWHYFPNHPLPLGNCLLPNLESQYVFRYFLAPHSFSFPSMILMTQMPGLFCHPCVLSLFFLQPFFSLFEGRIISTEVPSSSFFSLSSPSCHWIFGDSFTFRLFYFSVIQFPFGSSL